MLCKMEEDTDNSPTQRKIATMLPLHPIVKVEENDANLKSQLPRLAKDKGL